MLFPQRGFSVSTENNEGGEFWNDLCSDRDCNLLGKVGTNATQLSKILRHLRSKIDLLKAFTCRDNLLFTSTARFSIGFNTYYFTVMVCRYLLIYISFRLLGNSDLPTKTMPNTYLLSVR